MPTGEIDFPNRFEKQDPSPWYTIPLYSVYPSDVSERLGRIEAKLDRLLELLEDKQLLWLAPVPDEERGHWLETGVEIGKRK